jgi:hypothetical protein
MQSSFSGTVNDSFEDPALLEETRKNSFVFLLQILSPPPEHEETKKIRITRKIVGALEKERQKTFAEET